MSVRSRYKEQIAAEKAADAVRGEGHEQGDEATTRLQRQIDELKRAEELQRQQVAQQQQWTPDRVLQFWRSNGLDESGERFLLNHPQHIIGLTDFASQRARQHGHEPGSAAHTEAAKAIFHENLAHLEAQAAANVPTQSMSHEPAPYRPAPPAAPAPAPPLPQVEDERPSIVSAPVSREAPSESTGRRASQIRLTVEQREAARMAGITEVEYARQLQRLDAAKREEGRYAERRYS
jgi:hypothetical protein